MSSYHSDNFSRSRSLWPHDLKINRGHLLVRPNLQVNRSFRTIAPGIVELSLGQAWSLWPWPFTWWLHNRGHLLVTPSLHVKFEGHGCMQCRDITRTRFWVQSVTLTFDLMTLKSIWFIYRSPPASMSSLMAMGAGIVELSLGQALVYQRTDMCKAI